MKSKLVLIAALGKNFGIGKQNHLPWDIPEDFAFFSSKTKGKSVIMGYNTFVSLGKKPLKQRYNVVISDHPLDQRPLPENLVFAPNLAQGIKLAEQQESRWIMSIGGGQIYRQTLELADEMYLTHVDLTPDADVFFPRFDEQQWNKTVIKQGNSNGINYKIVHYTRPKL